MTGKWQSLKVNSIGWATSTQKQLRLYAPYRPVNLRTLFRSLLGNLDALFSLFCFSFFFEEETIDEA